MERMNEPDTVSCELVQPPVADDRLTRQLTLLIYLQQTSCTIYFVSSRKVNQLFVSVKKVPVTVEFVYQILLPSKRLLC